jgi:tetratricopeptide (TPR) repeat protein
MANRMWSNRMLEFAGQSVELGREDQAAEYLQQLVKKSPENLAAQEQLADLHVRSGQSAQAIRQLEQAVEATSNRHSLHVKLGNLYLNEKKLLAAERQAQLAVEMEPDSPTAWELKGDVHGNKREWSESTNAYQRALALDPRNSQLAIKICGIFLDTERPLRALSTIEQLIAESTTASQSQEILLMHGTILTEVKNYKRAIEQLQTACTQPNCGLEAYLRLSNAQLLAGRQDEARETLVLAQSRFPDDTTRQLLEPVTNSANNIIPTRTAARE